MVFLRVRKLWCGLPERIQLNLTKATVERRLRNVCVKLGAVPRLDAVNKAQRGSVTIYASWAVRSASLLAADAAASFRVANAAAHSSSHAGHM
jgi:hypothetical protein